MTVRDDRGAILSREAYSYEFDKFGNWTKMVTSLVVFENGELKREPIEVTYRTVTYYFDDTIAKIVESRNRKNQDHQRARRPRTRSFDIRESGGFGAWRLIRVDPVGLAAEPPPLLKSVSSVAGKPATDKTDASQLISAEAQLSLGHEFLKQQKDREAIKAFKESIKLNPNIAETHYGLGFSNFRLGRFRDAADAFKKATVLSPAMAKAHYGLSLSYQELGMERATDGRVPDPGNT